MLMRVNMMRKFLKIRLKKVDNPSFNFNIILNNKDFQNKKYKNSKHQIKKL